ncbi:MAG: nucleotidyltransferase domain-containing protein [Bacteroidota bacterium]
MDIFLDNIPTSIQPILVDFIEIMQTHYGEELHGILLYGSYAREEAHEESDIDVLVVLNRTEMDAHEEALSIVEQTHMLDVEYGQILSAMPISLEYWLNGDSFFLDQVKKDVIVIWEHARV